VSDLTTIAMSEEIAGKEDLFRLHQETPPRTLRRNKPEPVCVPGQKESDVAHGGRRESGEPPHRGKDLPHLHQEKL
jgi:hypothetical protein